MAGSSLFTNLGRGAKVLALLLFFLPWVTVSCSTEALERVQSEAARQAPQLSMRGPSLGGAGIPDYSTKPGELVVAPYEFGTAVMAQVKAVLFTLVFSGVGSAIIYKIVDVVVGLRVTTDQEREGLDIGCRLLDVLRRLRGSRAVAGGTGACRLGHDAACRLALRV